MNESQIQLRLIEVIERLLDELEGTVNQLAAVGAQLATRDQAIADGTVRALQAGGWLKTPAERARHDA